MKKRKTILIQKDLKKEPPQQLRIHNVPTDDVKNNNGTNKEGDSLLVNKLRTLLCGTERIWARGTGEILYIYQHILNESQDETKKSSYGVDWL